MNNKVLDLIKTRRATKIMIPDFVIDDQTLNTITESARWSSASYGVWTYRILVLERGELRDELAPLFYNQNQFINASHVILFVSAKEEYIKSTLIDKSVNATVPVQDLKPGRRTAIEANWSTNHVDVDWWAQKQAYIALSNFLNAASVVDVDSAPMEGFDKDAINNILIKKGCFKESEEHFIAAVVLGKADTSNPMVHFFDKIRMDEQEFTKFIK